MKTTTQLYIATVALIVAFDVAGSFVSRSLHYEYSRLTFISFCLYMLCGGFGFRYQQKILAGFQAGLVAGLADSTLGWAASTMIHPYTEFSQPRWSIFVVAATIVFATLVGGFFGFTGAVIAKGLSLMQTGNNGTA